MHRRLAVLAALAPLTGCIYANVTTPLAYRAPTHAEVPAGSLGQEVEGTACNHVVLGMVAWGNGGYDAALANAKAVSGATLLADVKSDSKALNVVAVYQRLCTRVTGKVVR